MKNNEKEYEVIEELFKSNLSRYQKSFRQLMEGDFFFNYFDIYIANVVKQPKT